MNKINEKFNDLPPDFVPDPGHADWDPDDYEPDVAEFMHNADFDHEAGNLAGEAVGEAIRDLTEQETQDFINYVEPSVGRNYQAQANDPYEDAEHPGEGEEYEDVTDARDIIAERSVGLSLHEQHLISQRMSLAMSVFGFHSGEFHVPIEVLDAIMDGTDFLSKGNSISFPNIPVDLPKKTKEELEKAIAYLLSISDKKFWTNMAIATTKIGLTPLDGCIFMNVTIGMFGLKESFVWDFENDRLQYINELKKQVHESKQGEKLYNFFTKIISFKYKNKSIPRSVAAALARDAFCLLYVELKH